MYVTLLVFDPRVNFFKLSWAFYVTGYPWLTWVTGSSGKTWTTGNFYAPFKHPVPAAGKKSLISSLLIN